jgi:hypothetical protein
MRQYGVRPAARRLESGPIKARNRVCPTVNHRVKRSAPAVTVRIKRWTVRRGGKF